MDRVQRTLVAFCAFCAFRRAFCPASALGAAKRGHGKREVLSLQAGSGGGFGGLVMPVWVYVVKGDQVRWVRAVDVTVVAGFDLAGS